MVKRAKEGFSGEEKQLREPKEHKNLASSYSYHKGEEKHPRRISNRPKTVKVTGPEKARKTNF